VTCQAQYYSIVHTPTPFFRPCDYTNLGSMSISCPLLATFLGCHWVPWIFTFWTAFTSSYCKSKKMSTVCWISLTPNTTPPRHHAPSTPAHVTITSHPPAITHIRSHQISIAKRASEQRNRPDTVPNGGGQALLQL
jgi:hypothetical protein